MTALAVRKQECKWTVMNGPLKGSAEIVSHPLIVIGRATECDIVIVDPKCSRKHVEVEWTGQQFRVRILSEHNLLWLNGEAISESQLKDGDVITIGETELKFNILESAPAKTTPSVRETSIRVVPQQPAPQQPAPQSQPPQQQGLQQPTYFDHTNVARPVSHRPPKPKSNVKGMVIAVAVIGLFFLWLLTGNNAKKRKEVTIRTEEQIAQDIEAAKKLAETAEKMRLQNNMSSSYEINHAQENYVKGFRDYRKGQYESAVDSFQACLALNPEHVLCNRYLRLSQRKFDELVEYHMVLGREYRDQNQFRACRTAFRNVLTMVKDQSSEKYKEAKVNFDACNRFVEGRF